MKHINFIPAELRPKFKVPDLLIPAVLVLVFMVDTSVTVGWSAYTAYQVRNENARIDAENAELSKKIEGLSASKERLKMDEAVANMKRVLAKKNYWSGIFRELSVLIPEGVWLTGFGNIQEEEKAPPRNSRVIAMERAVAAATGAGAAAAAVPVTPLKPESNFLVIKGESISHELVAQFLTSLEKSHNFPGVQMKISEKEENVRPLRYKFEFAIPVKTARGSG